MKNIKFDIKNKKHQLFIVLPVTLIIIIVIVIILTCGNQEKKMKKNMNILASDFYENFYYQQVALNNVERKKFVEKYQKTGIKINLDNLLRYDSKKNEKIAKTFINKKNKKTCDKTKSKAIIYPKEPYRKKDYKIEIVLECEFKK